MRSAPLFSPSPISGQRKLSSVNQTVSTKMLGSSVVREDQGFHGAATEFPLMAATC